MLNSLFLDKYSQFTTETGYQSTPLSISFNIKDLQAHAQVAVDAIALVDLPAYIILLQLVGPQRTSLAHIKPL